MSIEWFLKEEKNNTITIHDNNITLSKNATSFFKDCIGIIVGIDKETNDLIFKKIMKEQIENREYNKENLYLLTIKPSYGRINSKQLVNNIIKHYGLHFEEVRAHKYYAKWNSASNMLIVKMGGMK